VVNKLQRLIEVCFNFLFFDTSRTQWEITGKLTFMLHMKHPQLALFVYIPFSSQQSLNSCTESVDGTSSGAGGCCGSSYEATSEIIGAKALSTISIATCLKIL